MGTLNISFLLPLSLLFTSIASQQCTLDGHNIYPPIYVDETSAVGLVKAIGASRVISISPTTNQYIELNLLGPNTDLNVNLIEPLRNYFKEATSDRFDVEFLATCNSSSTPNFATVTLKDFNDPPEFVPSSISFDIHSPHDLTVPINDGPGEEIYAVDWDWEESFATNISFTTSENDKISIEAEKLWQSSRERPRKFKITIKLKQQLTEDLNFNVIAYDAADPGVPHVEQDVQIRVTFENTNLYPPKFNKHYYKAIITDLPESGVAILVDGGPISISDPEDNAFEVTTESELIQIKFYTTTGLLHVSFKKDMAPDDILSFLNGVAFVDITAKETATAEAYESTVVVALLFSENLTATTSTPVECTTMVNNN